MDPEKIRQQIEALKVRLKPLRDAFSAGTATAEQLTELRTISDEITTLVTQYDEARSLADSFTALDTLDGQFKQTQRQRGVRETTRSAARTEPRESDQRSGDEPGNVTAIGRGPARRFLNSEEFQRFQKNPSGHTPKISVGNVRALRSGVPSIPDESMDLLEGLVTGGDLGPDELRAVISLVANPGVVPATRLPGVIIPDGRLNRVRDLFAQGRTTTGIIEYVKLTTRTNNAAAIAESTNTTGALKPTSDYGMEVETETTKAIAHAAAVTRQALRDIAQLETILERLLTEDLADEEDAQLLNGSGTGNNLLGLLNRPGILVYNDAYFTTNAAANGFPADGNMADRIVRARTLIWTQGRARADAVAINPADEERFLTMKDGDKRYLLRTGGPDGGGLTSIWGLRVAINEEVPEKTAIVGAYNRGATVYDHEDVQLYSTDSHADWFLRNILAFLAEEQLGLVIPEEKHFARVALSA